jgi:predicted nuclease of restriction endonuclease-like RecB superfamily
MLGKKGSNQFLYAEANGLEKPKAWNFGLPGTFTGMKHTEESKKKISEKLSINNNGGRSKWYDVAGQRVQGTWERNIALKLEELDIKWIKLKTNKDTLKYQMNGKTRSYTPDFYLEDYDLYLEIKGFWWGDDREKMDIVLETHPEKKICIIEKEKYEKILQGELVW